MNNKIKIKLRLNNYMMIILKHIKKMTNLKKLLLIVINHNNYKIKIKIS